MEKAKLQNVNDLIEKKATKSDLIKNLNMYSDEVQEMAQNLYEALWRINLYESQIIYVINQALRAFEKPFPT